MKDGFPKLIKAIDERTGLWPAYGMGWRGSGKTFNFLQKGAFQ
jgi:hypothetical protein